MKTKLLIAGALLALCIALVAGFGLRCPNGDTTATDDCANCPVNAVLASQTESPETQSVDSVSTAPADSVTAEPHFVAYYFYTTQRCASCFKIETYSHEAIEKGFASELQAGSLVWKMINIDEDANQHFVEDYKLFTKALVLVEYADGKQLRWKNCQKVWELLNDKTKFQDYVRKEVRAFITAS